MNEVGLGSCAACKAGETYSCYHGIEAFESGDKVGVVVVVDGNGFDVGMGWELDR